MLYEFLLPLSFTIELALSNRSNWTWNPFLILMSGGGWRRDTHNGVNNDLWSSSCSEHFNSGSLQSIDVSRESLRVWLIVCSSELGNICRFTKHICQLKQTLDERYGEAEVLHTQ